MGFVWPTLPERLMIKSKYRKTAEALVNMINNWSNCLFLPPLRRGAGVVELACLESMYTRKGIKGSNPFSSAKTICPAFQAGLFLPYI